MPIKKIKLKIEGMSCNGCRGTVERAINSIKGVQEAVVDLSAASAEITYDDSVASPDEIIGAVNKTEVYRAVQ